MKVAWEIFILILASKEDLEGRRVESAASVDFHATEQSEPNFHFPELLKRQIFWSQQNEDFPR